MNTELDRRVKKWFLYQYPTPSTIEIYSSNEEWELLTDDLKPFLYDNYAWAKFAADLCGAWQVKVGEISELPAMRESLDKLAKWVKSHQEKGE